MHSRTLGRTDREASEVGFGDGRSERLAGRPLRERTGEPITAATPSGSRPEVHDQRVARRVRQRS